MKIKNKGKVHPSPLPPPFSSKGDDCLSVLRLLPAVILVLVSALSLEDRQVLAYLITRSLKTTTTSVTVGPKSGTKKPTKKPKTHKPPLFDCECFDCYTSYWFKWDSSPNRELIHQIIEAFEDHLTNGEKEKNNNSNGRGKKKDKSGRRRVVEQPSGPPQEPVVSQVIEQPVVVVVPDEVMPEKASDETEVLSFPVAAATGHKGLARKVLPDVLGLFNSRFWRLWNPNA